MSLSVMQSYAPTLVSQQPMPGQVDMDAVQGKKNASTAYHLDSVAKDEDSLRVATKLEERSHGVAALMKDSQEELSALQSKEDDVNDLFSITERLGTLAEQAADPSVSDEMRQSLNDEFQGLVSMVTEKQTQSVIDILGGEKTDQEKSVDNKASQEQVLDEKALEKQEQEKQAQELQQEEAQVNAQVTRELAGMDDIVNGISSLSSMTLLSINSATQAIAALYGQAESQGVISAVGESRSTLKTQVDQLVQKITSEIDAAEDQNAASQQILDPTTVSETVENAKGQMREYSGSAMLKESTYITPEETVEILKHS